MLKKLKKLNKLVLDDSSYIRSRFVFMYGREERVEEVKKSNFFKTFL